MGILLFIFICDCLITTSIYVIFLSFYQHNDAPSRPPNYNCFLNETKTIKTKLVLVSNFFEYMISVGNKSY